MTTARSFNPMIGRTFVHPSFDYLMIGGGLSLVLVPLVYLFVGPGWMMDFPLAAWAILLSNSCHFAASTVRLYTKPNTKQTLPFLVYMLPLLTIGLLTMALFAAEHVGRYFQLLYLTWSPYHYAAQAYGLSIMYAHRSGCHLSSGMKRIWWWIALLPFMKVLTVSLVSYLLPMISTSDFFWGQDINNKVRWIPFTLGILGIITPCLFFAVRWKSVRKQTAKQKDDVQDDVHSSKDETQRELQPVPLISLLILLTNALWFVMFEFLEAFLWATIFHGIQYLAVVMIFHVKDQTNRPDNRRGWFYHLVWFYAACLLLGYLLFNCWPYGYEAVGFNRAESVLMVIAAINIHHFVVDAYIWRVGRDQRNRKIVEI